MRPTQLEISFHELRIKVSSAFYEGTVVGEPRKVHESQTGDTVDSNLDTVRIYCDYCGLWPRFLLLQRQKDRGLLRD